MFTKSCVPLHKFIVLSAAVALAVSLSRRQNGKSCDGSNEERARSLARKWRRQRKWINIVKSVSRAMSMRESSPFICFARRCSLSALFLYSTSDESKKAWPQQITRDLSWRAMHVQQSVRRVKHTYYIERVSRMWGMSHRTWGYGSFWGQPRALFAMLGTAALSYSLFLMRTSRTLSVFRFCARLLALSFSLPSLFCRRNNETASAATALRTINLRKCTQLFVNRIF